jgi:hypothetical protein
MINRCLVCAGKSQWIFYAVARCLAARRSVIWHRGPKTYYFTDTGVQVVDMQDIEPPPGTWCFVDSAHATEVPTLVCDGDEELFPIYVTSPKESRWSKLHQLRLPHMIIMNPWTLAELRKA